MNNKQSQGGNTQRGGTHDQHVEAGRQSHKNAQKSDQSASSQSSSSAGSRSHR